MTATPPANDSKAASIAWAIATIVVALVAGLIAWMAMSGRGGNGQAQTPTATPPAATTEVQQPAQPAPAPTQPAPTEQAAPQTPSPEIEELLLGLQRRDAEDTMAVGDVDAPVVMIEYADYRCPYCAQHHRETRPELTRLVEDGTLRIEFRDLVIFDETSLMAALGGRGAAAQGLLEEYQAEVFALSDEGHGDYTREDLVEIAEQIGVEDLEAFEAAFDDPEILAAVQADTQEARSIGITSTPSFLINTQVVQGAYPLAHFEQIIGAERAKAEAETTGR